MFNKITKFLLGAYIILLLVILISFSIEFGFYLLTFTGIFAFVVLIFITNEIKKYNNSLTSRITSIILINLILYSTIILFYGLSNLGLGDKGFLYAWTLIAYLILCGTSIFINIIITILNKKLIYKGKINKILSMILALILVLLFYTPFISIIAGSTQSPIICSLHLEIKDDSFIFQKGAKNSCLTSIAIKENNPQICESNRCVEVVASRNQDLSVCNYAEEYSNCIYSVALQLIKNPGQLTPEICNVLNKKEAKDDCLKRFAFELSNKDFCLNVDDFFNCYAQLSNIQKNTDESQCDILLSPSAKEQCKRYVHSVILN